MLKTGDHPYWSESAYTETLEMQPDVIVLMLGTNDAKQVTSYVWVCILSPALPALHLRHVLLHA